MNADPPARARAAHAPGGHGGARSRSPRTRARGRTGGERCGKDRMRAPRTRRTHCEMAVKRRARGVRRAGRVPTSSIFVRTIHARRPGCGDQGGRQAWRTPTPFGHPDGVPERAQAPAQGTQPQAPGHSRGRPRPRRGGRHGVRVHPRRRPRPGRGQARRSGERRRGGRRGEGRRAALGRQGQGAGRRLHLLHRAPAGTAQAGEAQARREAAAVRGLLLGRRPGGRRPPLLALPSGGQGEQRPHDVLPHGHLPPARLEEDALPPPAAPAGLIRHLLPDRAAREVHPRAAARRLGRRRRDRIPLQRALLRPQGRRGLEPRGVEERDRPDVRVRQELEDQHRLHQ